jgi:hypothetical protein
MMLDVAPNVLRFAFDPLCISHLNLVWGGPGHPTLSLTSQAHHYRFPNSSSNSRSKLLHLTPRTTSCNSCAHQRTASRVTPSSMRPSTYFCALQVSCISVCGIIVIYASVDSDIMYQGSALFGQIVLGQSTAQWPRIANRPGCPFL